MKNLSWKGERRLKKPKFQYHEHHCHSEFSIGDSTNRISSLAERSAKRGCKSLTITDHGTLAGTFELQSECKKNGLKPIFGIEAYYVDEYGTEDSEQAYNYAHLILLCKNTTGWINLKNLHTKAWKDGFLRRPRISLKDLSIHKEGLIVCSACVRGIASWNLFPEMDKRFSERSEKERKSLLLNRIRKFRDLFGEDFYLEIQYLDIEEQKIANEFILKCADRFNCKVVATGDCHYLKPKDYKLHDIMICSSRGKTLNDPDNGTYNTHELFFKNTRMMEESWKQWHPYISEEKFLESVKSTNEISEKVGEVELKPKMVCLPKIAENPHEFLNEKLIEGIKKKCTKEQVISKVYVERLKHEKEVLAKLGMEGYMLVCADIIDLARKAGIPVGPGRGSVAGSLVAYLLDITQIDPIRHNTSFERFLTAERLSLPDIDMDFGREGREKVKELITEKYGKENFAAIMTFMIWKPRGLLKDIGRVQGRSFQDINFVTKAISPRTESFSDEENPLEDSVLTWLDDNKEIKNPAKKLDGIKKQRGIHASGMVLTPTKLEDWVPIAYMTERGSDEKKPVVVSEWDMYALEDLQILKIDLLGLKTLDVIDLCTKRINKKEVKIKDIWKECLDDLENPEIYKMISSGRILGLFQLETSEGMAKLIKDMQPHCFDDIVVALALYRTAIIRAGMLDEYIKRRNGEDFEYLHPSLEPILKSTYGILVYQESLMEIGVKCAGMTPSESDNFRKATKLKDLEKFKSWQDRFVKGCIKNGFSEDIADELWEWCVKWSGYGFNKCTTGDTKIYRFTGNQHSSKEITIKKLYDMKTIKGTSIYKKFRGQKHLGLIRNYDILNNKIRYGKVKDIYLNGIKEVFEIILENGMKIKTTINHRFMKSDKKYYTVQELRIGDEMLVCGEKDIVFKKQETEHFGRRWMKLFDTVTKDTHRRFIDLRTRKIRENRIMVLERSKNKCEICGTQDFKMEFHHKDGDHLNEVIENVVFLCNSCHKKEDYRIGNRTGKRDLGYLVEYSKIKSIEKVGEEETFDVEMLEDPHNFIANGFVSHNSHSSCYALLTYVTAWLKSHYPLEFMSSVMSFDIDDETIIEKYVSECRKMKIKVSKPDINKSQNRYIIRKNRLISPITSLDKVGMKVYENILAARREKRFESFDDFYDKVDKRVVNVRIITNLILGGCFSKIEESIEELFDRFIEGRNDKIYRQLFCSDCEKRYPCNIKESESEGIFCPYCGSAEVVFDILSMKGKKFNKAYLANSIYGFSNQENPLKRYVDIIAKHDVGSISELVSPSIEESTMYKIAAHVKRIKLHIDKRGGEMAFVDLSDGEDDVSLVIFASDWKNIKEDIMQGNCYIISALKNRGGLLYLGRNKSCKIIKLGL